MNRWMFSSGAKQLTVFCCACAVAVFIKVGAEPTSGLGSRWNREQNKKHRDRASETGQGTGMTIRVCRAEVGHTQCVPRIS